MSESSSANFERLEKKIVECRLCPRLVEWREFVAKEKVRRYKDDDYWGRPVPAFGSPDARLIIIGLAPAAHGGNRTGRMFTGDRSGEWLYEALHRHGFANQPTSLRADDGLELRDCLITAVLRCAPPDNKPLPEEITNCREYLRSELQMSSNARAIIALGSIAFRAFIRLWKEKGILSSPQKFDFCHGGEWSLPGNITLISSYHPSQQNTQTGKLTRPMFHAIFSRAREIIK